MGTAKTARARSSECWTGLWRCVSGLAGQAVTGRKLGRERSKAVMSST